MLRQGLLPMWTLERNFFGLVDCISKTLKGTTKVNGFSFPIQYPALLKMYKNHEASFWTAEETDLAQNSKVYLKTCSLLIEQYIRDPVYR